MAINVKTSKALSLLKEKSLSNTGSRKRILEVLMFSNRPLSAHEIYQGLFEEGVKCNESTVYRNLQKFLENDLIQSFTLKDGVSRYEFKKHSDDHHHHIVCLKCKMMKCLDLCKVEEYFEEIIKKLGFVPVSHNLEFYGVCKSCTNSALK